MNKILLLVTISACVYADNVDLHEKPTYTENAGQDVRDKLMEKLLESYNKASYPENTTINFGLHMISVNFEEELNHVISDVWFLMAWEDGRLAWNKGEYDVDNLRIPSELIWTPDAGVYNGKPAKCENTNAVVTSSGYVIFVPPCEVTTFCNLTLGTHPYQEQICHFKFGSWTFDAETMGLKIYKDKAMANTDNYMSGSQYQITTNKAIIESKTYSCCKEPYMDIMYTIGFTRKHPEGVSCNSDN